MLQIPCVSRKGYYNRVRAKTARLATEEGYDESTKASAVLYFCRRQREKLPRASVVVLHKLSNEYFRDIFTVGRDWLYKLLDANNMLLRETKKKRSPRMTRGVSIMALRITSKLLPVIVISNTGNRDH